MSSERSFFLLFFLLETLKSCVHSKQKRGIEMCLHRSVSIYLFQWIIYGTIGSCEWRVRSLSEVSRSVFLVLITFDLVWGFVCLVSTLFNSSDTKDKASCWVNIAQLEADRLIIFEAALKSHRTNKALMKSLYIGDNAGKQDPLRESSISAAKSVQHSTTKKFRSRKVKQLELDSKKRKTRFQFA